MRLKNDQGRDDISAKTRAQWAYGFLRMTRPTNRVTSLSPMEFEMQAGLA
jgi:hypothetical protein